MGSELIREDRSRLPGKKQLGKLGEEENEEKEPATERRREYTDLGLDIGERDEHVACHGFGDDRRSMSGGRDVSLTIFITSMSGSKTLTSFIYRIFHFKRPPGLRLASSKEWNTWPHSVRES